MQPAAHANEARCLILELGGGSASVKQSFLTQPHLTLADICDYIIFRMHFVFCSLITLW